MPASPGETGRTGTPRRRWLRPTAIGVAAVALVATVTVVTVQTVGEPPRISGTARPLGSAGGAGLSAAHEPQLVAEFPHGRFPKKEGRPSEPDPGVMEVHGQTGYFAYTTPEVLHVTAINLADGAVKWRRQLDLGEKLGSISMVATDVGLLFVINFLGNVSQFSITMDLETGEDTWHASETYLTVSGVVNNHLIVYNSQRDNAVGYEMATKDTQAEPKWAVGADGGRSAEFFQETSTTHKQRRDDGDLDHTLDVGANQDAGQYIVNAVMYSGAVSVRELATGTEMAKGNAGEKMTDLVAYEDTIYVHRKTPRTLAAYAATDLSKPKWSITAPPSEDGAQLTMCAENLLCLNTRTGQDTPMYAIDAATGQMRWQKTEYQSIVPASAGAAVAASHKEGTTLLDPQSGEVINEFSSSKFALPGNGVLIGFDNSQIQLLSLGAAEPRSLGAVPDEAMAAGNCEWTNELALCAGKESYKLWRYRG